MQKVGIGSDQRCSKMKKPPAMREVNSINDVTSYTFSSTLFITLV